MLRNYLKITLRVLWKNKVYSVINVLGLAVGMTTCVLIALYVTDETSYDKHHPDGHRIYRVASEVKDEKYVATPAPIASGLKEDFPEVEQVTRLLRFPGINNFLLTHDPAQKRFYEKNGYYVDSTFFQLFNYDFKFGNPNTALNQPNSIILSENLAAKLFGNANPLDKALKITLPFGDFNYTVKGVFRNTGNKSHVPAQLFLSMNNDDVGGWVKRQTNWANNNIFHTYVKLREHADAVAFERKLPAFLKRNGGADFKAAGFSKTLFLQPLTDIYLHSNYGFEVAPNGSIEYLYIFTSIAIFLLLIACINFMNLSTARSEKRAKEVGIRKVVGAVRGALVGQFLGESLLMSGLALCVTCVFLQVFIHFFNELTHKDLSVFQQPQTIIWLLALLLVTGLLAGLYPAFYLSAFKPITALKGKLKSNLSAVAIRKGLVVFQFTISTVLILGAILISQQMKYLSSQHLGFDKNQKIIMPLQSKEAATNYKVLKNELSAHPQIIASAMGSTYPGVENVQDMLFYAEGKTVQENVDIHLANVENDYIETLGIRLLRGRGFAKEFTADSNALVLNEAGVYQLGYTLDNAVGRKVYYDFQNMKSTMTIIGVLKNYHFQSLYQEIKPMALTVSPFFGSPNSYLIVNVKTLDYPPLLADIEKAWKKINPNSPFEYSFLDKDFQNNYEKEERTSQLIRYFTIIGIFIACLGLYGLASFVAEQRTKEIGIRKVLGASLGQIISLLSKDFLKLVLIAFVIASPIAWYFMHRWLQNFAYRIDISWWIFALAGGLAVLVALLTVSFQAVKSALADPVKSLRSE